MMKTLGLVLALLVFCAVSAAAVGTTTVTYATYPKWNLISAPCVPLDPTVDQVFAGYDVMFTAAINRWKASDQGMIAYDAFDVPGAFGNILLGDGYWFNYPTAGTVSYTGLLDGVPSPGTDGILGTSDDVLTDMWVSLPGSQLDGADAGGWHLIGNPFNHEVLVDSGTFTGDLLKFTDGTMTKTWDEASVAGWVDSVMTYWNGQTQGMEDMGYFFNTDDRFRPGKGYWLRTRKDNLAMIVPAVNP